MGILSLETNAVTDKSISRRTVSILLPRFIRSSVISYRSFAVEISRYNFVI